MLESSLSLNIEYVYMCIKNIFTTQLQLFRNFWIIYISRSAPLAIDYFRDDFYKLYGNHISRKVMEAPLADHSKAAIAQASALQSAPLSLT